ncbi:hypothetical protein [Streptomyces sp. NRRL S-1824]|uniref:hypothetical protein n=1 Tax=Streptomyces sp. NRRL S-1824 TaxID=1463889 RepID=UPI000A5D6F05|nr:hypothetical protein [Streptomyces sp. NRRL S-1824]
MTSAVMKVPVAVGPTDAFRRACRYEWRHLTALRSTWILLGVVAVLSVLSGITVLLELGNQHTVSSATVADVIAWTPLSMQIPALCFFVMVLGTGPVSTDLVSGAARTTWLAVNGRGAAYGAKCAVGFTVGVGAASASALLGALSCAVSLAMAGASQPAWTEVLAPAARFVGWMGCWALLCLALVALLRSRIVPVLLLVLWPLLGERLAGALLGYVPGMDGVGDWLPFAAGRAMLTDVSAYSDDERSFAQALVGSHLPTPVAVAIFCLYTVAVTAAGFWAYCRRDAKAG